MEEKTAWRERKRWKATRKILLTISSVILIIGIIITIQGIFSDPLKEAWKLGIGFIIFIVGLFSFLDTYNYTFKMYLKRKNKAR